MSWLATRWVASLTVSAGLTAGSKQVLAVLADHADSRGTAFPSTARLAAFACVNVRSVPRILSRLIARGFIVAESGRTGGRSATRYRVCVPAGFGTKTPDTESGVTPDSHARTPDSYAWTPDTESAEPKKGNQVREPSKEAAPASSWPPPPRDAHAREAAAAEFDPEFLADLSLFSDRTGDELGDLVAVLLQLAGRNTKAKKRLRRAAYEIAGRGECQPCHRNYGRTFEALLTHALTAARHAAAGRDETGKRLGDSAPPAVFQRGRAANGLKRRNGADGPLWPAGGEGTRHGSRHG